MVRDECESGIPVNLTHYIKGDFVFCSTNENNGINTWWQTISSMPTKSSKVKRSPYIHTEMNYCLFLKPSKIKLLLLLFIGKYPPLGLKHVNLSHSIIMRQVVWCFVPERLIEPCVSSTGALGFALCKEMHNTQKWYHKNLVLFWSC